MLLLTGTLSWSLIMLKSGLPTDGGIGFWGPNGHDGVWHIALAKSLARGSLDFPTFAGEKLTNYHLGFDLMLAGLTRLTTIPVETLYFQILPPIMAFVIGFLVYKFAGVWAAFFTYFGGSLGWFFGKGESMFWAQQAISTLINPPFALSLIFLLLGLIFLQRKRYLWSAIFFGILIQIKAYAGILALGGLLVAGVWQAVKDKKFNVILTFLASLTLSSLLFLPLNRGAQSLIVFKPFWFLETMMQLSDRVGWPRFGEAMVNYKYAHNYLKSIPAYIFAFLVFWYGNMGTRFLGEIYMGKKLAEFKKLRVVEVFIFSVIVGGVAIPMLFLQAGTPWNTIQFFYYSLFFAGILAGMTVAKIKNKLLLVVIALLTLPTTFITLKNDYLPTRPPAKLSSAELEALEFLANQPAGVVLTYPFDRAAAEAAIANPPRPLYLYESTAYVAAYGDKQVFLEDEVNLDITGYDWRTRREEVLDWLATNNQTHAYDFLRDNNISYIYWVDGQRALLGEAQLGIKRIFENQTVNIYEVVD